MKYDWKKILPVRDSAIYHGRFNGNLNDIGPLAIPFTILAGNPTYHSGYTENGTTVVGINASTQIGIVSGDPSSHFFMSSNSFTVEAWIKTETGSGTIYILDKLSGVSGFSVRVNPSNVVQVVVGDGSGTTTGSGNVEVRGDGEWHYVVVVFDRPNLDAIIYVDGVLDVTVDISTRPGSWYNPSQALRSYTSATTFYLDELTTLKGELLTAEAILERYIGRKYQVSELDENFLMKFLPMCNHNNPELQEFLKPFSLSYDMVRQESIASQDLIDYDQCPTRFLTHLAATFGFELIDKPYATEQERRQLIKNMLWIYKRRGTRAAIEKIIEILGFTYNWTEVFPTSVPLVSNYHKVYSIEDVETISFNEPFDHLGMWNPPLNGLVRWSTSGTKAIAICNSGATYDNVRTFNNTATACRIELEYEFISVTTGCQIGIIAKYQDASNYVAVRLNINESGTDYIELTYANGGAPTTIQVSLASLASNQFRTGKHKLWMFFDDVNDKATFGIDNLTLAFNQSGTFGAYSATKKGIYVATNCHIEFDSMKVSTVNYSQAPLSWTDAFTNRKVQLELIGSPTYATNKKQYIENILPEYLPAGCEVEMV